MPSATLLTYVLLAAAIVAVWAPPPRWPGAPLIAPWSVLFGAFLASGLLAGVLHGPALLALLALAGAAYLTAHAPQAWLRLLGGIATALLALALALHKLPGFNNVLLIDGVRLSPDAAPFTQYANADKGAVGLILLALLCRRVATWRELAAVLRAAMPALLLTLLAVLGLATLLHLLRPDLKLSPLTAQFLLVNLFFTVVAEEAFFRGFLQARLAAALGRWRGGAWIALACSAVLFGAAHLAGGTQYALLAGVAGVGYAWAYQASGRIEAPIALHFALNAVHFIGFTYPALR